MINKIKKIDLIGQLLCFIVPIILGAYLNESWYYIFTYFSVGSWQLLSFLISAVTMRVENKSHIRKVYSILVLFTFSSSLLLLTGSKAELIIKYIYIFFTPFMAVMYFVITFREFSLAESLIKRNEFVQKR